MGAVSNSLHFPGAVDLGALAARKEAQQKAAQQQASPSANGIPAGLVIDVTTATFEAEVLQRSMTVPVVLDLWASWCGPCKTLSPVLERLAGEYAGRWVLAKVDVDAEQQIAAAFQVQSIPSVFAVIGGQPLPLFQGALPEPQVRQYLEALLAEAAKHGITGTLGSESAQAVPAPLPEADPAVEVELDAAYAAIESADWAAARAAYGRLLDRDPQNADASAGLALVTLYERTDGADIMASLQAAKDNPQDVPAQLLAADLEAINGDWGAAFDRLIRCVLLTSGPDRAAVRDRLVELFDIAGPLEPAVAKARRDLANALF